MLHRRTLHRLSQAARRGLRAWLLLLGTLALLAIPTRPSRAEPGAQALDAPVLISEIMADPNAVEDELGEWIELANRTDSPIDLHQWRLRNASDRLIHINGSLIIPPHGYILLARHANPKRNGGIVPAFTYQGFSLANALEEVQLLDPNGQVMDRVAWGGETLPAAPTGASWERVALDPAAGWVVAALPWPGSAGDYGSPGAAYTPPHPTPTPPPDTPPRLYLSELMIDPVAAADETGEWIELFNQEAVAIHLAGWLLADDDHDEVVLGDLWIEPGAYLVVGRSSDATQNGGVVVQGVYSGLQLANEADELRLVTPWGVEVDRVTWGPDGPTPRAGASLERTAFEGGQWVAAHAAWPGSAGDLGTPGMAYQAPPTPTPTATIPAQPPRLYLSELMIDPAAVPDAAGEWVELYSAEEGPVALAAWQLVDQQGRVVTLTEGTIPAHGYAVIARQGDPAQNGGVPATTIANLQLTNEGGTLTLVAPWGAVVDQVAWGGTGGPAAPSGASLERTNLDTAGSAGSSTEQGAWVKAHATWSGSAGDLGSPGSGYIPPPPPTPTATPLPLAWPFVAEPSALQIDQVYGTGSGDEYIVISNQGSAVQMLDGWRIGDAEIPGKGEGMVRLPDGMTLAPGERLVISRDAAAFRARWGFAPAAAWAQSDGSVPLLARESLLGTRDLALNNQGDEVLLLDPTGRLADVLAYGDAAYQVLGLAGRLSPAGDQAFYRAPGAPFPTVRDLRHRFLRSAPDPNLTYSLPGPLDHGPVGLADGLWAWWGTLGAHSTFSPDGAAPPHVLLAEAAGMGLDFVAIADTEAAPDALIQAQASPITTLPAWQWHTTAGQNAIVYGAPRASPLSWGDLFEHLAATGGLAQLPASTTPVDGRTPLFAADELYAPGGLTGLYARWAAAGQPLLPAGNHNLPIRGAGDTRLRYTGLVAADGSPSALLGAMAARRGWLTSSPGLWLTLRTGEGHWMGSEIAPGNEVLLVLAFGDRQGEAMAVALWQDDQLIRQLDLPPADGQWQVSVPAVPGSFLYAVATQRDGDFAVTAPLYVVPEAGGSVIINEALPAPNADHNGDGEINTGDEFVEFYNPGTAPFALAGWQLYDASGHRFTFGPGRFIGAGEYLLLWRKETGLSLNDDGDSLRLVDDAGTQIEQVGWGAAPRGHAYGRLPGSREWRGGLRPTPGQPNEAIPVEPPRPPKEPDFDPVDVADPRSPVFGQATGAPGSLALGKLRGLYAPVEFRGQVTVPPGLFNSAIYVAEPAGTLAGLGVQVYLDVGEFMPMQEGDWVLVRGEIRSFRGEMEIRLDEPGRAWRIGPGTPLLPLPVQVEEIGESLEGRLVTFDGVISGWQGDSLYMVAPQSDPRDKAAAWVRVTVRSSLDWRRPYVQIGERYRVIGVVSQFGTKSPWNDGYRVLI